MSASDRLAYDRASVRRVDHDGRLHVELTNISKATVNPYYGREIPGAEALGLKPDTIYQLFRDPAELETGAATFNNIPLLMRHKPVTPEEPAQMLVVGSTGTDAVFEAPFLKNSLVIWVADAIDAIENETQRELSCAYHYVPIMGSGEYQGQKYDGRMTQIKGNHVALVEQGRAGPDVVIGDAMPPEMKGNMQMPTSRKALLVHGALSAYLRPKLAQDAKIDLKSVLLGTTAHNYSAGKPAIVARLKTATTGKLAKDADLKDVHELLDSLDREGEDEMDDDDEAMDAEMTEAEREEEKKARAEDRKRGMDAAGRMAARDARKGARDTKRAADKRASDEEAETEEEKAERMKKRAADKAAADKRGAKDETPEEKDAREKREKAATAKDTKAAMDSAIDTALTTERKRQAGIREAEIRVRPWIGNLAMAQDSAEAVYRLALDSIGVKASGVHPDALWPILEAQPKPGTARPAMDSAARATFAEKHPEVTRIRVL